MAPSKSEFAAKMLTVAREYVGISRTTDAGQIAKFLALFGLPFSEEGVPVAFCASGLAWSACKAYCELTGISFTDETAVAVFRSVIGQIGDSYYVPNPSCSAMVDAAQKKGNWLDVDSIGPDMAIKPGWLILYDFGGGDHHVEIVAADLGDEIDTVGFNTCLGGQSGVVAYKRRNWSCIWGYITIC